MINGDDTAHSAVGRNETGDDGVGPQIEPAPHERAQHDGREIVLGPDSAGKAIAGAAAYARLPARIPRMVDGERKREGPATELPRGALDPSRDRSEAGGSLRVRRAALRLRGVGARGPGHTQQLLGFGVVGLEIAVAPRPAGARVADDLRCVLEVPGAETEGNPAVEDRRAADAVEGLRFGLSLLVWGVFVRTVFVWHVTWSVNSLTHIWGYRNYDTTDSSRNNWFVGLVAHGEGWHNNHHAEQRTASHGHRWWEVDLTYLTIRALEAVGLVKDVVRPRVWTNE